MRRVLVCACLAVSALAGCAASLTYVDPDPELADDVVDQAGDGEFDDLLADSGTWVTTAAYGDLFCPSPLAFGVGFVPYTRGRFVAGPRGWTFLGDLPLSWAVEHYGSWVPLDFASCPWAWIPGSTWGPAWVDFSVGAGVIAWSPSGPPMHIGQPPRTHVGAPVVASAKPAPPVGGHGAAHAFVPVAAVRATDFGAPRLAAVMLDAHARAAAAPSVRPLDAATLRAAPATLSPAHAAFDRAGFSTAASRPATFGSYASHAGSHPSSSHTSTGGGHAGHR